MKKTIISVLLILLCFQLSQAQLLWKITGKGLDKPSYLFGTHHLIPIQFLDSVPGLYPAFNQCDAVVGEMVMNNIDAASQIQKASVMPDSVSMKDLFSDADYEMVDNELRSVLKMGLKEMAILKPALIQTMYELELYKKMTGFNEDEQSDSYFQAVAYQKGKKVIGLETVEKQIEVLLGGDDLKREAELLVETIRNKDLIPESLIELNDLYKAGKIEELVEVAKEEDDKTNMTPEEYARLVDDRNFDWIAQLPAYMESAPCFIAVGALHLGGENGLVNQLKKAGYKVKPVTGK